MRTHRASAPAACPSDEHEGGRSAGGGSRTHTSFEGTTDFESVASANSATPAGVRSMIARRRVATKSPAHAASRAGAARRLASAARIHLSIQLSPEPPTRMGGSIHHPNGTTSAHHTQTKRAGSASTRGRLTFVGLGCVQPRRTAIYAAPCYSHNWSLDHLLRKNAWFSRHQVTDAAVGIPTARDAEALIAERYCPATSHGAQRATGIQCPSLGRFPQPAGTRGSPVSPPVVAATCSLSAARGAGQWNLPKFFVVWWS